jgi:hypothetical protein
LRTDEAKTRDVAAPPFPRSFPAKNITDKEKTHVVVRHAISQVSALDETPKACNSTNNERREEESSFGIFPDQVVTIAKANKSDAEKKRKQHPLRQEERVRKNETKKQSPGVGFLRNLGRRRRRREGGIHIENH